MELSGWGAVASNGEGEAEETKASSALSRDLTAVLQLFAGRV